MKRKLALLSIPLILLAALWLSTRATVTQAHATDTHTVYLPLVLNGEDTSNPSQERDITEPFLASAVRASCAALPEEFGYTWDDVYNCTMDGLNNAVPVADGFSSRLVVERNFDPYTVHAVTRTFIEYALPNDIPAENVTGIRFCFNDQFWQPDEVFIHKGTWAAGAMDDIFLNPGDSTYYAAFFANVWQAREASFYTIDPLPVYYTGAPCTEVTVPVNAALIQDGYLRWVLRTADENAPSGSGAWGLSNYEFDGDDVYYTVTLLYQP